MYKNTPTLSLKNKLRSSLKKFSTNQHSYTAKKIKSIKKELDSRSPSSKKMKISFILN